MELLLSRYSNIEYINDLPIDEGIEIIIKAYEKRDEERAFKLYTARYTMMDKDSYMSFEEFYDPKRVQIIENRPIDEILLEVKETIDALRGNQSDD